MKCARCGGALRTPASIARGMGERCARLQVDAAELVDKVLGPPRARLMFPDHDAPLVAAAKKEVEIAAGKSKRGVAALIE